jgi:hypothetical protein
VSTYTNIAAATSAVTNRFVTSTNMKNAAYTVVNSGVATWSAGFLVTVTHTQVGGVTDVLGTITIVGTSLSGQTQTEVITPLTGTTATGTKVFRSVATVTGAGWTRDAGAGSEDTIVVGNAAGAYLVDGGGKLDRLIINTAAAATIVVADARGTIQTIPSNQAAGTMYLYELDVASYLKVTTTSTNDITVIHSASVPSSYAMS